MKTHSAHPHLLASRLNSTGQQLVKPAGLSLHQGCSSFSGCACAGRAQRPAPRCPPQASRVPPPRTGTPRGPRQRGRRRRPLRGPRLTARALPGAAARAGPPCAAQQRWGCAGQGRHEGTGGPGGRASGAAQTRTESMWLWVGGQQASEMCPAKNGTLHNTCDMPYCCT